MNTRLSSKIDYMTLTRKGKSHGVEQVENGVEAFRVAREVMYGLVGDSFGLEIIRAETFYPWVFLHHGTGAQVAVSQNITHQGVRVTFSGQHIQSIEWANRFIHEAVKDGWRFTRLDIALDIVGEPVVWRELRTICEDWCEKRNLSFAPVVRRGGETIYLGARTSNNMARFYDKGRQQKVDYPWTRLEMEVKGDTADAIAKSPGAAWVTLLGHFVAWVDGLNHWVVDELRHYYQGDPNIVRPAKVVKTDRAVWFNGTVTKSLLAWAKKEPDQARSWLSQMSSMLDILDGSD